MPKFTVSEQIQPVEYDFSPPGKPDTGPAGVVPEPSSEQILQFQETWAQHMLRLGLEPGDDTVDDTRRMLNAIENRPSVEEQRKLRAELIAMYAELCSQHPSVDELAAQPWRYQEGFIAYLTENLLNPEG